MTTRPSARVLLTVALLLTAGCSQDEPAAMPVTPSPDAASVQTPPPAPSPSPSPSPSPTPLSPFEDDPAVQAVRAYERASVEAINARNLELPAFAALATARRQARHAALYEEDLGSYYPGPAPLAILGVSTTSPTGRSVVGCLLDDGFALDKPGGTPTEPRLVVALTYEMVLEGGAWKVHAVFLDEDRSCDGVPLPGDPA